MSTKILFGLHPRIFLLNALKMLANEINIKEIWGISNASHRSLHFLVRAKKATSYDLFWLQHGVFLTIKGFMFSLRLLNIAAAKKFRQISVLRLDVVMNFLVTCSNKLTNA